MPTAMIVDDDDDDLLLLGSAPAKASAPLPVPTVPTSRASPRKTQREEEVNAPDATSSTAADVDGPRFATKGGNGLAKMALLSFGSPSVVATTAAVPKKKVKVVNNGFSDRPKDAKLQKVEAAPVTLTAPLPATTTAASSSGALSPSSELPLTAPAVVKATKEVPVTLEEEEVVVEPVEKKKVEVAVIKPTPASAPARPAAPAKKAAKEPPKGQPRLDSFFTKLAYKPKP